MLFLMCGLMCYGSINIQHALQGATQCQALAQSKVPQPHSAMAIWGMHMGSRLAPKSTSPLIVTPASSTHVTDSDDEEIAFVRPKKQCVIHSDTEEEMP